MKAGLGTRRTGGFLAILAFWAFLAAQALGAGFTGLALAAQALGTRLALTAQALETRLALTAQAFWTRLALTAHALGTRLALAARAFWARLTGRARAAGPAGRSLKAALVLSLALFAALALAPPLFAAGELARAKAARAVFLQNASSKTARADWLALIVQFEEAAQAQPKTEPAAQARFLGAELAWLSFERFGQPPDAQKAKALARRVVRDCPRCESTPGAQVLIGRALIAEGQPDEAYRELMKVELNFPRSQERVTARSLMTALRSGRTPPPEPDKPQGQATGQAPAAGAAKPPEKAPAPDPAQTPPTSPAKGQAPALAQKPLATRRPKVEHPPLPPARPDGKAQVYALNLVDYGPYQEVVAYVDQSTPYVYNLLPPTAGGRFRVYADLKGARLYPKIQANLKKSTDLVKLVKISQLTEDATRLVADLPEALAYRPLLLGNPTRLVIQVAKEAKDLPPPEPEAPPAPPPKPKPKPKPKAAPSRPARGPANSLARQLGLKIRRVIVDPGHGGKDAGATGHGVLEKDVALKVGLALAEKIRKRLGLEVLLTRDGDRFVTLDRRSRIARESQGDLFISIHVNANSLAKVEGFETYILNFTDDRSALDTAARENAASDKSMSQMFNILEAIAKNTRVAESRVLAKALHSGALAALGTKYKVRDLGVKEAVFLVLVNMSVPSILLEIGFVTNSSEAKRLSQAEYLDLMTDGLVDGLKNYVDGLPK